MVSLTPRCLPSISGKVATCGIVDDDGLAISSPRYQKYVLKGWALFGQVRPPPLYIFLRYYEIPEDVRAFLGSNTV
jgi:hypothetical protein